MAISENKTYAIILAAGKGTRMKSDIAKVLSPLKGRPLIAYVLDAAYEAGLRNLIIVIGFQAESVRKTVLDWAAAKDVTVDFALQEEQLGTGHAVMMAKSLSPQKDASVLILLGDVPLIQSQTIQDALSSFTNEESKAMVLSMELENPFGYGRIIRNASDKIERIVEEKDANEFEKEVLEVNTGIFIFESESLWLSLKQLDNDNSQNEYYLTDVVAILNGLSESVGVWKSKHPSQFVGINSKQQLAEVESSLKAEVL